MSTMARKSSNRSGKARKTAGRQGKTFDRSTACPSCAGRIQDDARYCPNCGKPLDGGSWLNAQTLTVLAAALIVLVALGLLFSSVIDTDRLTPGDQTTAATSTATSAGQPPDLSSMTPREAADRLFNRVMMADEQGDDAEVAQFAPMAVSAYEMLDSMDPDALYHVGLVQAAAGNIDQARDFNERLKAIVPNHLLGALLDYRLAKAENKTDVADAAARRFQDHYDDEMAIGRPEYQHHQASLERFRAQAGATGGDG
jgi:hypothetical protein